MKTKIITDKEARDWNNTMMVGFNNFMRNPWLNKGWAKLFLNIGFKEKITISRDNINTSYVIEYE